MGECSEPVSPLLITLSIKLRFYSELLKAEWRLLLGTWSQKNAILLQTLRQSRQTPRSLAQQASIRTCPFSPRARERLARDLAGSGLENRVRKQQRREAGRLVSLWKACLVSYLLLCMGKADAQISGYMV
jgi:hypothetical protein